MTFAILIGFIVQVLRISIPYVCAAMGGVATERSGVVDLALEAKLLAGAFGAAAGAIATGSAVAGLMIGIASAIGVGLLHALSAVWFEADAVMTGVALNILAVGATRLSLQWMYDSSSNSPKMPSLTLAGEQQSAGAVALASDPLFWTALVLVGAVHFVMYFTRFGLRVRAVGENPDAAETLGVSPKRIRIWTVIGASAVTGLGGAWLAFDQRQFTHEMSAGRGFIALAAVIVGGWRPLPAAAACVVFATLEALQIALQGVTAIPSQLLQALPFVLTIVAVAGVVRRTRTPSALGR